MNPGVGGGNLYRKTIPTFMHGMFLVTEIIERQAQVLSFDKYSYSLELCNYSLNCWIWCAGDITRIRRFFYSYRGGPRLLNTGLGSEISASALVTLPPWPLVCFLYTLKNTDKLESVCLRKSCYSNYFHGDIVTSRNMTYISLCLHPYVITLTKPILFIYLRLVGWTARVRFCINPNILMVPLNPG